MDFTAQLNISIAWGFIKYLNLTITNLVYTWSNLYFLGYYCEEYEGAAVEENCTFLLQACILYIQNILVTKLIFRPS